MIKSIDIYHFVVFILQTDFEKLCLIFVQDQFQMGECLKMYGVYTYIFLKKI